MNQVVYINQDAGYLMIDIINEDVNKVDHQILITGRVVVRDRELPDSIIIHNIKRYDRSSAFLRIKSWLIAFFQILWVIKTKYRNADLFIVSNPPFTSFLPLLCKNNFALYILDIYPDTLFEHKIIGKKNPFVKLWSFANKKAFKRAERIITLTQGMKQVLSKYVDEDKIKVVPIWTSDNFLHKVPKDENIFLKKHGLSNYFNVVYSGNFGHTHDIEIMLELAKRLSQLPMRFVLIGDGAKKQMLEQRIQIEQLNNCILLPWQTVDMLKYSMSSADIALVTLGHDASKLSIPSKTYNLFSVGAPILAVCAKDSELANLLDKHKAGKAFNSDQVDEMIHFIKSVYENSVLKESLAANSLAASVCYSSKNVKLIRS